MPSGSVSNSAQIAKITFSKDSYNTLDSLLETLADNGTVTFLGATGVFGSCFSLSLSWTPGGGFCSGGLITGRPLSTGFISVPETTIITVKTCSCWSAL